MNPHDTAARVARVWSVVYAGRRLADPRDPLGAELRRRVVATSGLSPQGVELALRRSLETSPRAEHVARLVGSADRAPRVWVLLAANVFTAPLRAIACATAAAPAVWVRPSRRDPVVTELLARALRSCHDFARAGGTAGLAPALAAQPGDELHLYGRDATLEAVGAHTPAGVRLRLHGTGLGVAIVAADCPVDEAARSIADDVVVFDQRGCLSPRFVLVEGGPSRAVAVARKLSGALLDLGRRVPRGRLDEQEHAAATQFRAMAEALDGCWTGPDHCVAADLTPQALLLPPPHRCVLVVPCRASTVGRLLDPWARHVVAIGGASGSQLGELAARIVELLPAARRSDQGRMQSPPLDGPVDLREKLHPEPSSTWAHRP